MMTPQEAFDQLAAELEPDGIKKSNMFGMPVLKLGKKPIAGLVEDGVNFKLKFDSEEHKTALGLDGAHMFQPVMHGKKGPLMKQWVVVSPEHYDKYMDFAEASITLVEEELNKK
jgi:hypothetical protein